MEKFWLAVRALAGRPTIVMFNDGTFGVRKGLILWRYLDLNDQKFWWFGMEYAHKHGSGTLEQATMALYKVLEPKPKQKGFGHPIALKFKD